MTDRPNLPFEVRLPGDWRSLTDRTVPSWLKDNVGPRGQAWDIRVLARTDDDTITIVFADQTAAAAFRIWWA